MERRSHRTGPVERWASAALLAFLCTIGVARPCRALPPELEYAKGVVALSLGQLPQAEAHFSAVLAQQPDNLEAAYYLGQVALQMGQTGRAVELLRQVQERDPTNAAVQLDLALALVKSGQLPEAERELTRALELAPERPAVYYYLGFCRYRLGRFEQAIDPLEQARSRDGGFAASAAYYLGLAFHELGQRNRALQQFEQLAGATSGDDPVASLARENLSVLAGQDEAGRAMRWWGTHAAIGFGYDSNVTLEPSDFGHGASPGAFFAVGFYLLPLRAERDGLEVAANVYRSFNFASDTRGLDLTDVSLVGRYRHGFASGHALELAYLFDLDLLDDLASVGGRDGFGVFMHGHTAEARARISEGRFSQTSLIYRFQWRWFDDWRRTHFGHQALLRQDLALLSGRLRLGLELGGQYEDARGQDWNLWGLTAALEARARLYGPLSGWLQVGWTREDHLDFDDPRFDGRRIDDLFSGGVGLSVALSKKLSLTASYRYLNNDSNGLSGDGVGLFRYTRHLVTGALLGHL